MPQLWINERESISVPPTMLTTERATRDKADGLWAINRLLPNPDPVLKKQGKDITAYTDLLSDGHLGGALDRRIEAVLGLEWEIDRGKAKSRQAKELQRAWNNLDLRQITTEMLHAWYYGYQIMEILWEERRGLYLPYGIVGKPQKWFNFDAENKLRFLTFGNPISGESADPPHFLPIQHQSTYDNPYGFPVASRCFWPITFKKGGAKFLINFAEKFGIPWVLASYPDGWKQERIDEFYEQTEAMIQDALLVLPASSKAEIVTTGANTNASLHQTIISWADSDVSKAILGHGAAADSTPGKLGNEQGATDAGVTKLWADASMVTTAMNKIIRWTVNLNWGRDVEAPRYILFEQQDVDGALADRDSKLYGIGWRPRKSYFVKSYGMDESDFEVEGTTTTDPLQQFARQFADAVPTGADPIEPDQALIDRVGESAVQDLTGAIDEILNPIREFLDGRRDYTAALDGLAALYPKLATKQLEQKLTQLLFMADVVGRLSVEQEHKDE